MAVTFLLDENVTERLISLLILLGYDATSVGRIGSKGRNDAEQLLLATTLGYVVVTYDAEDYQLLHRAWRTWSIAWKVEPLPRHAAVLVIRSAKGLTAHEIAHALDTITQNDPDLTDRYFEWARERGWEEVS